MDCWLAAHHASESELWLQLFKKSSGQPTVSYREAVEVALCWGWIDGLKKALDERAFLQRFTPRRPRSIWSQINRELVEKLIREGRMQPPGLVHVQAAQADGRWEAAYASPRNASLPPELKAAIEANPLALATYRKLNRTNIFALAFRFTQLKTAAARERKLADLVAMLARGETLHPLSSRPSPAESPATGAKKKAAARAAPKRTRPRAPAASASKSLARKKRAPR